MTQRVGVMGGTFDPIHYGHLLAANEAAAQLQLDEVVFIPAGDPWQKADRELAPAEHRLQMVANAISGNPLFSLSKIEIDRTGPSYAVDTLTELNSPDNEVFFIMGVDVFAKLDTWHQVDVVRKLANFIVCTRPGHKVQVDDPNATAIEIPQLEISSTMLRERIANNEPIRYLTPDSVAEYISAHDLYRKSA